MAEADPTLINAWLADELDDASRQAIDRLLAQPTSREQLLAEAQLVDDLRRAWADRHPERLADRVDHLLDHDRRSARLRTADVVDRRLRMRRWLPWAAAALLLIGIAGIALSLSATKATSSWIASLPGEAQTPADWPPTTTLQRQWRLHHRHTGATLDIAVGSRVQVTATKEELQVAIERGSLQVSGHAASPIQLLHADARVLVGDATCRWLAHAEPQPHGRLTCQEGRLVVVLPERRFELHAQAYVDLGHGGAALPRPPEPEAIAVLGLAGEATIAELRELVGSSRQHDIDSLLLPVLPPTIDDQPLADLARDAGVDLIAVRRPAGQAPQACFFHGDGRPAQRRSLAEGPVVFDGGHGRIAVCDDPAWLTPARWPATIEADLIALSLADAVPAERLARLWQRHWRQHSTLGLASGYRSRPGDCGAALIAGDRLVQLDPQRHRMVARYRLPLATGILQLNDYDKQP